MIDFLTVDDVIEIHLDQVERYGGAATTRDLGLLESAVAAAASTFDGEYLHPDIFAMAAAYLFHIVGNHPFVDGNKRTGVACALVFLEINGVEISAPESELEAIVWQVARGKAEKRDIAVYLEAYSKQDTGSQ